MDDILSSYPPQVGTGESGIEAKTRGLFSGAKIPPFVKIDESQAGMDWGAVNLVMGREDAVMLLDRLDDVLR
jgi:hypothetical protein